MSKWLKSLFCKHEYENKTVFTIYDDVDVKECIKCTKRIEINRKPREYNFSQDEIEDCRTKGWEIV